MNTRAKYQMQKKRIWKRRACGIALIGFAVLLVVTIVRIILAACLMKSQGENPLAGAVKAFESGSLFNVGTERPPCKLTEEELAADVPLLLQTDMRWDWISYGESTIGESGCAPTCISMIAVGLTKNKKATPKAVAEYAEKNGYYVEGSGTTWDFITRGCAHFGVQGVEISLDRAVVERELGAGHPIICSMRPGDFTTEGHFIVLTGVRDGGIEIHDPNSAENSEMLWDYDRLAPQIKNLWSFHKI